MFGGEVRATGKEGKAEVIDSKTITALFVFWICNTGNLNLNSFCIASNSCCDAIVGRGKGCWQQNNRCFGGLWRDSGFVLNLCLNGVVMNEARWEGKRLLTSKQSLMALKLFSASMKNVLNSPFFLSYDTKYMSMLQVAMWVLLLWLVHLVRALRKNGAKVFLIRKGQTAQLFPPFIKNSFLPSGLFCFWSAFQIRCVFRRNILRTEVTNWGNHQIFILVVSYSQPPLLPSSKHVSQFHHCYIHHRYHHLPIKNGLNMWSVDDDCLLF